jgi:predicted unusual protein kinase regulating ubiquinone biosynthesis (AarF/ABC1/UbiB family)
MADWHHLLTWLSLGTRTLGYYLWFHLLLQNKLAFYERTLQLLRNQNILFTKVFQSLTNSSSLPIDPELRSVLSRYTTNVTYTEDEIDHTTIDDVEKNHDVRIDRRVVNSGMIALVFHGTTSSGDPIVLKLKRRDIDAQIRKGCESTRYMYDVVAYLYPRNIVVRILKPFIENIDDIIDQCDFDREIQNMLAAAEDYAELSFIQIPAVHNHSSSNHNTRTSYILMDRIVGHHVMPPEKTETERLHYLYQFCLFNSFGMLSNAIQHTDLHSGNILFTDTGLGVIDFGMALRVSDTTHEIVLSIADIVRDGSRVSDMDYAETFKHLFVPVLSREEITDPVEFRNVCEAVMLPLTENVVIDELNIQDRLEQLSTVLKREIHMNREFYKMLLSMTMMGCVRSTMGPDYKDADRIHEIETRAINAAFMMIM